jgi:predicted RNA-binding protein (virulence factor B family)
MSAIGQRTKLRVMREASSGLYLHHGDLGDILLPGRYIPKGVVLGDDVDVFIYRDSEDRLVATTETPYAMVGEFAYLKVVGVNAQVGAFLDWGLSKDLLLPVREQVQRVRAGDWVVAGVRLDERSGRIFATTQLNRHLDLTEPTYKEGQPVNLLVAGETPLGFKAIVENAHWGLLYHSDLSAPLIIGRRFQGYIRTIRPGGKIDLSFTAPGFQRVAGLKEQILEALKAAGGRLELDDQSSPDLIQTTFQTSKKAFKQALGALFRERLIRFTHPGIALAEAAEI